MEPPRDSFARASLGQMMKDPIDAFFATYPPAVRELAASVRAFVRSTIPDVSETLDEPGRVVGYGIGAGYSGIVWTIIPSKAGVERAGIADLLEAAREAATTKRGV